MAIDEGTTETTASRGTASRQRDVTRMRNQPALTSTTGTTWIVVAGVSAALLGTMLLIVDGFSAVGVSAIVVIGVILVSMVVVRALMAPGRLRLTALAGLYVAMLVIATAATIVIALTPPR